MIPSVHCNSTILMNPFFHLAAAALFVPAALAGSYTVEPLDPSAKTDFLASKNSAHVLVDPDFYQWGTTVIPWKDGKYYAYFSQWPRKSTFDGWMTHCSVKIGVSDTPEGPYKTIGTAVESRHQTGWDVVNAHNPYVTIAGDKICLYYIANNIRGKFETENDGAYPSDAWLKKNRRPYLRNSQITGVAIGDNPRGPFVRSAKSVVDPNDHSEFNNIAVNPAVIFREGVYHMIIKGDDPTRKGTRRIQLVGQSKSAEGPFTFEKKPVYAERQTEDACLWFNQVDQTYNMVCHLMGAPDLAWFVSKNGTDWQRAAEPVFMKKHIPLSDGTIWTPARVERPFVFTNDKGEPQMIFVAILDKGITGNIALKLTKK